MNWNPSLLLWLIALVVYIWIGYPILLALLRLVISRPVASAENEPFVSIILPVHNEQDCITGKLEDCLQLDYSPDRLEIIVVSDNSSDATEEIVQGFAQRDSRIQLLRTTGRAGKSGAQNFAVQHARGEVLFLTDAETRTRPDLLKILVADLADAQVGLVTANVHFGDPAATVAKGQGFYWRYECFLRQAESDLGILATASGQAIAMRRELFCPMQGCYGDDCILPLDVRLQNYRVVYEPKAVAFDTMPHTIEGELRARIRMTARNWTGTLSRPRILNPFTHPLTSLGLVSHKLLRWLTPFLLIAILAVNAILAVKIEAVPLFALQILFYAFACFGWVRTRKQQPASVFGYAFSFCLANVGFLLGMVKVIRSQRIVAY